MTKAFLRRSWQTKEAWIQFGVEKGYTAIRNWYDYMKTDKIAYAWYNRGTRLRWLGDSIFRRTCSLSFKTYDSWREYGYINNYDKRTPSSFRKGANKYELAWYMKGAKNGWISNFPLQRKKTGIRKNLETKKPRGYWKDFTHVRHALETIIAALGHFPSDDEIREQGIGGILTAIKKYHGNMRAVKKNMGYDSRKTRRYWENWDVITSTLTSIVTQYGDIPPTRWLREHYPGFMNGVARYHGNLTMVKERMSYSENSSQELEHLLRRYAGE